MSRGRSTLLHIADKPPLRLRDNSCPIILPFKPSLLQYWNDVSVRKGHMVKAA